ncbi:MAG: 3-hydroxyacyl-CoA dehydrogenase [Micrococcales bacterium]|nr:3-hydroxyacyl-CoA dehydrogenase [Micrococcales bacterium]
MKIEKAAVIGAGAIGLGWAIVFARAGLSVSIFDSDPEQLKSFRSKIQNRLELLSEIGILTPSANEVLRRISESDSLSVACSGAGYIQECGPERIEIKASILSAIEKSADSNCIIASSSSAIRPSLMTEGFKSPDRFLVVHPANPPYLLPIAEVVPSLQTSTNAVEKTLEFLQKVGMQPVLIKGEPEGFVFNRLQGALLREAYCLVRDGVIAADQLDLLVTQGLGRRWSIIGPFATSALNVKGGNRSHAARMADSYHRMGLERGQDDPWSDEIVDEVSKSIEEKWKVDDWEENVMRRDLALMKLVKYINQDPDLRL